MKKSKAQPQKKLTTQPIIDFKEINSLQPWETRPRRICGICGKKATRYTKIDRTGSIFCQGCCTATIEYELSYIKVNKWPRKRIEKALSSEGSIGERLAVLTHIQGIQVRMDIRDLLIENLDLFQRIHCHTMSGKKPLMPAPLTLNQDNCWKES